MLYPVPKVLELVVFGVIATRVGWAVVAREVVVLAVLRVPVAARDVVVSRETTFVALRAVAPRAVVPDVATCGLTDCDVAVRDTVFAGLVMRCGVVFWDKVLRETVDVPRTAALDMPMLTKHAKIKAKILIILSMKIILAKKNIFGQGLILIKSK